MSQQPEMLGHLPVEEVFLIDNLETLKVVADPLRLKILELLRGEPRTVKQIAADLKTPIKKLYYHVNLLEEHGLIRITSTRVVSGILEKQYRVTAYRLSVERALLSPTAPAGDEGLEAYLSLILDHAKSEIKKGVGPKSVLFAQQEGLILRAMGDRVAFCPPLIMKEAEIEEMFDRYERALDKTLAWAKSEGLLAA